MRFTVRECEPYHSLNGRTEVVCTVPGAFGNPAEPPVLLPELVISRK